jgi:two-component system OmpR family sensor kinase
VHSLRTRIALLVFGIVLGSIAIVYLGVVPTLEASLRQQALDNLVVKASRYGPSIVRAVNRNEDVKRLDERVRDAQDAANARVTLLGINLDTHSTWPRSDSTREVEIPDLDFDVALDAAVLRQVVTATEGSGNGQVGEAALPVFSRDAHSKKRVVGSVLVFSAPLDAVARDVALIRRRILLAGAIALLAAGIAGLVVAQLLSRRLQRLEGVAAQVAGGDLSARFPVDARDELGQLARTLETMRQQLAELDAARRSFIATASHELRTPLFSLGGFLELLEDEDVDEEDRRAFLGQLRAQVARLQKLAVDLLDLSRLEAGSFELRPEPTDLRDIVRQVAAEFGPALATHDTELALRLPESPVEAVCDPARVAQVLRILLDNALTHTPEGTGFVVSALRHNGTAQLGVGDFGPGIQPTMLPRIFEPFVTTDDAQGSGLGLAIARELTERMAGQLQVASGPGRTTFTLELPA